jgi:hypothetical protein
MMGDMSPMPRGLGFRHGRNTGLFSGSGGLLELGGGGGMGSMQRMPGAGVMPPNFGYPFRQPPSLIAPGRSASGMSM